MVQFIERYTILLILSVFALILVIIMLTVILRAAFSNRFSVSTADTSVAVAIILLFTASLFFINSKAVFIAAALLALSGATSIGFSPRLVRVINAIHDRNYTTRLPYIWGAGVLLLAVALVLGLT